LLRYEEELDGNDPLDEEEQQAIAELDLDREASDAQEIEEMAGEIERGLRLKEADIVLGTNALTKVNAIYFYFWLDSNFLRIF
jgi:hypothetical protein